jgi:hypothetical protein
MYYGNEDYTKPEFDTLEVIVHLTNGQTGIISEFKPHEAIAGVEFTEYWRDGTGRLTFLAPKLTEILTLLKGVDIGTVTEWKRKSTKNNLTRTINALEKAVAEKWARTMNGYARSIKELKAYAEGEATAYTMKLEKGQYGFVWSTESETGFWGCGKVTIAPVPFISLDGTPTVEWVCDGEGFYLSLSGGNRRESNTERYGTLETALERGKAMCQALIDETTKVELQNRQEALAKLAEIEAEAFIKVQEIA